MNIQKSMRFFKNNGFFRSFEICKDREISPYHWHENCAINFIAAMNMTDSNMISTPEKLRTSRKFSSPHSPSLKRRALILFARVFLAAVIFKVLTDYVFGIYLIKGNSMYPSLRDGDLCITYRLEPYTRSEVVAYQAENSVRFARITAAGGDTVEITKEGVLLINGYQPAEEIFYRTVPGNGKESVQLTVDHNEWYLLNDYREDFSDSDRKSVV